MGTPFVVGDHSENKTFSADQGPLVSFLRRPRDDRATAIRDTWRGTTEHRAVVRARSLEESMEQALLALHLTYKEVQRIESMER
jgi:hypothetical protein